MNKFGNFFDSVEKEISNWMKWFQPRESIERSLLSGSWDSSELNSISILRFVKSLFNQKQINSIILKEFTCNMFNNAWQIDK